MRHALAHPTCYLMIICQVEYARNRKLNLFVFYPISHICYFVSLNNNAPCENRTRVLTLAMLHSTTKLIAL